MLPLLLAFSPNHIIALYSSWTYSFFPVFSTESEQKKILTQAVDAKKEREFAEEFNMMRDQLEEASVHNLQLKISVCMNICYFEGSLSLFVKNSMSMY